MCYDSRLICYNTAIHIYTCTAMICVCMYLFLTSQLAVIYSLSNEHVVMKTKEVEHVV